MSTRLVVLACAALVGCVPAPRPRVLEEVDRLRNDPRAAEAEELAPQAFLSAEKLRRQASDAASEGDTAAAQILGEHAIADYNRAFALSRLAKAQKRLASASTELASVQGELASLDSEQLKVAAEADDLEMRIKVARDALPLTANEPSNPEREKARHEAAVAIATQARLLCASARLLTSGNRALVDAFAALDTLDRKLSTNPKATPIDETIGLRTKCLSILTHARRPALQSKPEHSPGDVLLAELSRARLEPSRDDRGVVVTIHDAFQADRLTDDAQAALRTIGQVARQHGDTPLLVVAHSSGSGNAALDTRRARAAADALQVAGATKVDTESAGDTQPILPPRAKGAATRNERLEVIFVTPGW